MDISLQGSNHCSVHIFFITNHGLMFIEICREFSYKQGFTCQFHWMIAGEMSMKWKLYIVVRTVPAVSLASPSSAWWRHQMETFSALLAICAGNSPVPGEFPTQRPVTRSFDVYFDLRPDNRLSKQSWGWWFETLSHSLWRHRNGDICRHSDGQIFTGSADEASKFMSVPLYTNRCKHVSHYTIE